MNINWGTWWFKSEECLRPPLSRDKPLHLMIQKCRMPETSMEQRQIILIDDSRVKNAWDLRWVWACHFFWSYQKCRMPETSIEQRQIILTDDSKVKNAWDLRRAGASHLFWSYWSRMFKDSIELKTRLSQDLVDQRKSHRETSTRPSRSEAITSRNLSKI